MSASEGNAECAHVLGGMSFAVDTESGGHLAIRGVDGDSTVTNADVELLDVTLLHEE